MCLFSLILKIMNGVDTIVMKNIYKETVDPIEIETTNIRMLPNMINKYLEKERDPDYACNAVYAAMIEHVDKSVGDIMDAVDQMGLAGNTVFVFYSDNGGVDNRFHNIPLLGG